MTSCNMIYAVRNLLTKLQFQNLMRGSVTGGGMKDTIKVREFVYSVAKERLTDSSINAIHSTIS